MTPCYCCRHIVLALSALLMLWSDSAGAADRTITFDQVLDAALRESMFIREIEAKVAADEAGALALKTMPNPELMVDVRPYVSETERDTEYEVGIQQSLRLSNFGARSRVAALSGRVFGIERRSKLKEFEQSLLLAYGKAWVFQEKQRYMRENFARIQRLQEPVGDSGRKGLIPLSTQKLFLAENRRVGAELKALEGDKQRAVAELTRRAGITIDGHELQPITLRPIPTFGRHDLDAARSELPLPARMRLRAELAGAEERLARLDAYPGFAPRLAFEHTNDGDDRINLGFSLELPLSDRNQFGRMRAASERSAREAELRYLDAGGLAEELRLLSDGANAASEQAEAFHDEVLPAVNDALRAAERELRAGQGNALQVWQTIREVSAMQDRHLELWIKALSARVELAIMLGTDQ